MFRFVALLVSIVGAAAFAPMARVARSSAIKMSFESEIGAQPPLGFWDPLGLLNDADEARFARLREVETKHGRISMLAILGHLVTTAGVRLPADLTPGYDLSSTPTGLAALSALPAEAIFGTLLVVALIEGGYAARKVRVVSSPTVDRVVFSHFPHFHCFHVYERTRSRRLSSARPAGTKRPSTRSWPSS
jgi:hypothetical protein